MALKNIELTEHIGRDIFLYLDPSLADILIGNVLQNAIKHNVHGGSIAVFLGKGNLTIRNTGEELSLAPDLLFERFRKNNSSTSSLGLGLSIVKKICDIHDIDISYRYQDQWHEVMLAFPDKVANSL